MEAYLNRPPCRVCEHFAKKRGDETDCANCLPELLEENEDAARIYPYVYDQMIFAPSGKIISLNINTVMQVMEAFGVENKIDCLQKIRMLFYELVLMKVK